MTPAVGSLSPPLFSPFSSPSRPLAPPSTILDTTNPSETTALLPSSASISEMRAQRPECDISVQISPRQDPMFWHKACNLFTIYLVNYPMPQKHKEKGIEKECQGNQTIRKLNSRFD